MQVRLISPPAAKVTGNSFKGTPDICLSRIIIPNKVILFNLPCFPFEKRAKSISQTILHSKDINTVGFNCILCLNTLWVKP